MTTAHQDNGFAVLAAMAGGGLLLWLLLRHQQGLGLGGALGAGDGYAAGAAAGPRRPASSPALPERCRVRIDLTGLQVDGVAMDLPMLVARCREVGAADVFATGRAREGQIGEVMRALLGAGVRVRAAESMWPSVDVVSTTRGTR